MTNRLLLVLALLAFSLSGFSQAKAKKEYPKDPVPREERYNKMKELYIKELDSKTKKAADSLFQLYVYKMTPEVEFKDINPYKTDYLLWVKDNLSKTEFKDFAEAEKLWGEYTNASTANVAANKEYYDYLIETIQVEGGIELSSEVAINVRMELPEKFKRIMLPKRKKKSDFYPKLPGQ